MVLHIVFKGMFFRLLCITLILITSSCLTKEKYNRIIDYYVGRSDNELIKGFGFPDRRDNFNGAEYWVYERKEIRERRIIDPIFSNNNQYVGMTYWCETTFVIRDRIVDSVSTEGNDCSAN